MKSVGISGTAGSVAVLGSLFSLLFGREKGRDEDDGTRVAARVAQPPETPVG